MELCYSCNEKFTDSNSSQEHILLNSIGGRLKSKNLLCKDCNSKFGYKSDRELSKQLQFLANYLNIKREKGENQPLKGLISESGKKYNLTDGSKPSLSKPEIEIEKQHDQINYSISARDEKELIGILNGIKKKHPELNIDEAKKHFKWKEEYLTESLTHNMAIGGNLAFKSIVKTAVNYYIFIRNEKSQIEHLLPYLKDNEELSVVHHFHPKALPFKKEIEEVSHTIHLVGNKHEKALYCFIEFFSCYSFLVLLSDNYIKENFVSTYTYDVIQNKIIDRKVKLLLKSDFIKESIRNPELNFKVVKQKLDRVMQIGDKIQNKKQVSIIIENSVQKIFERFSHESKITEQMIDDLSNEVSIEFAKYLHRNQKK
ncbi:HNH endonuclease [Chryseobacterium sp.]|uniref:HNH endonuclease n=1 Tax=Chryseobacterium sp. TaxID=1871047 RepID=UPI0024E1CEBF|nr:HNH endonuclease [Chryseobacterium sp.]